MESRVANVRVRTTGTIGGNLCFAEPHSDPATLFNVLNSSVVLQSSQDKREIPIGKFVIGAYETSLKEDELLTHIRIPLLKQHQRTAYTKFQVHERPTLGLALLLEIPNGSQEITLARVAVGCVSPFPQRCSEAETLMVGEQSLVEQRLDEAADILADQAELVDDAEGGIDYKRSLIHTFLHRAYHQIVTKED
jgi:carbon-monoxide dehydrogenase medium subunit